MNKQSFKELVCNITGEDINIKILINQDAKKWYDKTYKDFETITEDTIYGIIIEKTVVFDFKVGKFDSLLKTFITQYINKYAIKIAQYTKEGVIYPTKEQVFNDLKNNNSQRLGAYLFYSTNYGIGLWQIFMNNDTLNKSKLYLDSLLKNNNITFKNENSEAGWVYRWIFEGNYLDHNEIIKQINVNNF